MRILTLALSFIFIIMASPVFSRTFTFPDTQRHSYKDAISYVYQKGTVSGYPDGYFRPQSLINRAELVKIMVNSKVASENIFIDKLSSDLKPTDWFAPLISTALRENIVSGYPDGTFRPANNVTFVEAAKIIVLALNIPVESKVGSPWFESFVKILDLKGAIPPTINYLDQELTRGDVAEIIYRLEKNLRDKTSNSYETLLANGNNNKKGFEYFIEGSTHVVKIDSKRARMNILTGNNSIQPRECDFPNHCVAEVQAESFQSYFDRSQKKFLVNGAFFDAYTAELDGINYHETGGDIIINGEVKSMFGWDNAFGDGGMLARMKNGTYKFYYPIREWLDEYDDIDFAISNYPLVLNNGQVINKENFKEQAENDYKFWLNSRRAGLALSSDGQTIFCVNTVGDVATLGQTMLNRGAAYGFQLDSGGSMGFAYDQKIRFKPGRRILTAIEFY